MTYRDYFQRLFVLATALFAVLLFAYLSLVAETAWSALGFMVLFIMWAVGFFHYLLDAIMRLTRKGLTD